MSAARLLTGRPMHEPIDRLDPETAYLIWESDKGPMGFNARIWREQSGELDVWVSIDWEDWHVESVAEAREMGRQAERLAQWANELAGLLTQIGWLK